MSKVYIVGTGAVSPAGWGVAPLLDALQQGISIETHPVTGPTRTRPCRVAKVPAPPVRPGWLLHPRMRRTSAISHYAMAAAVEALADSGIDRADLSQLGIVSGTHMASVQYSAKFCGEVLLDPATASPLIFPETVINAPASHLAAVLGVSGRVYSIVSDQTAFVQALITGCEWLHGGEMKTCLVVGMEEAAWSVADVLRHFMPGIVLGEGAGALVLARRPARLPAVVLELVTDAHLYTGMAARDAAAAAMRRQLPPASPHELLVESRAGTPRADRPERLAWSDWTGQRVAPRMVLGEGLSAATAWQFVIAAAALRNRAALAANISVVGANAQAIAVRLAIEDPDSIPSHATA